MNEPQNLTPMLRQYFDLKAQAGDAVLFCRMGDFYEIFGPDAEEIAPKMDVVLTSRERGDAERMPFCGVPYHSVKTYWLKLLKQGYKVAIAEQLEDPAQSKGLVERGIVRTLTPGCIDELEALDSAATNYILAVYECPTEKSWSALVVELSTGELRLGKMKLTELPRLAQVFRPKEIWARSFQHEPLKSLLAPALAPASMDDFPVLFEALPEAPLRDASLARDLLKSCLGQENLDGFSCGKIAGGAEILAAALQRLRNLNATSSHFRTVKPLFDPDHMILGPTAVRDLELFETALRRQQDGSLARTIDRTLTPMGSRRLRELLARPLVHQKKLCARLDVVEFLAGLGDDRLAHLRDALRKTSDLARLTTRVMARSVHPSELVMVRQTLGNSAVLARQIRDLAGNDTKAELLQGLLTPLAATGAVLEILLGALAEHPAALGSGSGVFREGWNKNLDSCNALAHGGENLVAAYEQKLRGESGIGNLKIKPHKTFGLLIEITRANAGKVPAHFIRRQTMVNCERFATPDLDRLGTDLLAAQDAATCREAELYAGLLETLAQHRDALYSCAEALAEADVWQAFAWLALKENYCRPVTLAAEIAAGTAGDTATSVGQKNQMAKIKLLAARHPVVERNVGRHNFVANDVEMTAGVRQLLITGPNMAGKSTIMRQTAICAILHQAGSFVPASAAELPVFDRVFTRVGASDDLSRGLSTFMVEMTEAAEILREATSNSLVILDEVGRGTSTTDGLAIAAAILEEIATRNLSWTLFATHYHELVGSSAHLASVKPVQTEVLQQGAKVIFTHRLISGASGSSYGIEVARLAGVPEAVLARAQKSILEPATLARHQMLDRAAPGVASIKAREIVPNPVLERLETVRINRITPLQALNLLAELTELHAGLGGENGKSSGQGELFSP